MIGIFNSPEKEIERLKFALGTQQKKLSREISIAINATAKMAQRTTNKQIREELATAKKNVDKAVSITRKAKPGQLGATVVLKKGRRLSLRFFNAKQNKKGVSFKISKKGGRKSIPGAFQGPKPGVMKVSWRGNAFVRIGKSRLPIVKLKGPSPWGVVAKKKLAKPTEIEIRKEFEKQLKRRTRLLMLRASGKLKGQ